jgi:hypothetical protein
LLFHNPVVSYSMSQPTQAFNNISAQIEENRQFSGYYKNLSIPATPKGNQTFKYEVGQNVTFSELSPIRGSGIILERYKQNGFCYYVCSINGSKGQTTQREKDLK